MSAFKMKEINVRNIKYGMCNVHSMKYKNMWEDKTKTKNTQKTIKKVPLCLGVVSGRYGEHDC